MLWVNLGLGVNEFGVEGCALAAKAQVGRVDAKTEGSVIIIAVHSLYSAR